MTVKSTSIYLGWVGLWTVVCGALWEGMHRFLLVNPQGSGLSVVENPRAALVYLLMGVIFGSLMWAISTTPEVRKTQATGLWAKVRPYRILLWWAGLSVGARFAFPADNFLVHIGVAGFVTMFGWALLSQRADRAQVMDRAALRMTLGVRLAKAIHNVMFKAKDDATTMYLTPLMNLALRAEDSNGYWSDHCTGLARATVATNTHLLAGFELAGQKVNPGVWLATDAAKILFNERDFDREKAEAAVAAVEAL
jgi:hypothetical protein